MCTTCIPGALRVQKKAPDPLELELQMGRANTTEWVPGAKSLQSSPCQSSPCSTPSRLSSPTSDTLCLSFHYHSACFHATNSKSCKRFSKGLRCLRDILLFTLHFQFLFKPPLL